MTKCRLCLQEKQLIKAHIIPQFMYKGMKDEKNVFLGFNYNKERGKTRPNKLQTGEFDKTILCEDCDNRILGGHYEKYAKTSFFGGKEELTPDCRHYKNPKDGTEYSICENIDYTKMKLFMLSVLWRASVTQRPFFKEVDLGEKHEERIRKILYEGIDPQELEYPILLTSFMRTANPLKNMIGMPKKIKYKSGHRGYSFLMRSVQFIFLVNSINHSIPEVFAKSTIKESGEITVFHLKNGKELEFLKSVMTL